MCVHGTDNILFYIVLGLQIQIGLARSECKYSRIRQSPLSQDERRTSFVCMCIETQLYGHVKSKPRDIR